VLFQHCEKFTANTHTQNEIIQMAENHLNIQDQSRWGFFWLDFGFLAPHEKKPQPSFTGLTLIKNTQLSVLTAVCYMVISFQHETL